MDIEELQSLIEGVQRDVAQIKREMPQNTDKTQLMRPLDASSKQAIAGEIQYPVSVRLKNTDPATTANYGPFFIADKTYRVASVAEVHGVAGSSGSAVTLNIEKLTGTTAAGSGVSILAAGFNLKGTANTVQYGTLVTSNNIILLRGDRMALKLTGTPTAVADLVVTVYLQIV